MEAGGNRYVWNRNLVDQLNVSIVLPVRDSLLLTFIG